MANGIDIPNTNGQYDTEAYENLPEVRKEFGDDQNNITISNGIRTNVEMDNEFYMRVRQKGVDVEPTYYENELNKTHIDNLNG